MIRIAIRRTGAAILGCALVLPAGTLEVTWASQGAPAAAEAPMVGVLQLTGNNVSEAEARGLTDRLRVELFETGGFTVLERARMEEILREQGFQLSGYCDEATCLAEAGKLLPVESMIGGSVSRVGTVYSLSLRRVDVETGKVIQTATDDCECPIAEVLTKAVRRAAWRLAGLAEAAPASAVTPGAGAPGGPGSSFCERRLRSGTGTPSTGPCI